MSVHPVWEATSAITLSALDLCSSLPTFHSHLFLSLSFPLHLEGDQITFLLGLYLLCDLTTHPWPLFKLPPPLRSPDASLMGHIIQIPVLWLFFFFFLVVRACFSYFTALTFFHLQHLQPESLFHGYPLWSVNCFPPFVLPYLSYDTLMPYTWTHKYQQIWRETEMETQKDRLVYLGN